MRKFKIVCNTLSLVAWFIVLVNEVSDVIAGEGFNPAVGIAALILVVLDHVLELLED